MGNLKHKNIEKLETFVKFGEIFTKVWADDQKHVYVFKRQKNGGTYMGFEVVRGHKFTNPDGSVVYAYPSSEEFGKNGYYINGRMKDYKERIQKYIEKLSKDEE